jgi:hypothetical protein
MRMTHLLVMTGCVAAVIMGFPDNRGSPETSGTPPQKRELVLKPTDLTKWSEPALTASLATLASSTGPTFIEIVTSAAVPPNRTALSAVVTATERRGSLKDPKLAVAAVSGLLQPFTPLKERMGLNAPNLALTERSLAFLAKGGGWFAAQL